MYKIAILKKKETDFRTFRTSFPFLFLSSHIDPNTMQVSRQAVIFGEMTSAGILVESGVNSGDQIIAAGVHFLQEGQKVRPWERERGL